MSETLTETELSARWKMSKRTLQMWRVKGIGPRFIRIGERSIFYRVSDVQAYELSCTVGSRSAPPDWDKAVIRAIGVLTVLAEGAKTQKAADVIKSVRTELQSLIS